MAASQGDDEREHMSEPTGAGWTSPGGQSGAGAQPLPASPPPGPQPPGSQPPGPQGPPVSLDKSQVPPAWQGQAGWGAPGWGPPPEGPRPGVVPLRPLGLGELLDGAVGLVRGYPRPTLGASALVALVTTLLQLVLVLTVLGPLFDVDAVALEANDADALVSLFAGVGALSAVSLVVGTVAGALMTGVLTGVAGKAVLGQPLTSGELWRSLRGRLPRLVAGSLLFGLAVYGPPLLAGALTGLLVAVAGTGGGVVGGLLVVASFAVSVLLYVRLSLATPALVLEDARVLTSFRRSWVLVRRSFWRVLGILLLAVLIGTAVASVLQVPFSLLSGDGGPLSGVTGGVGQSLSTRALVLSALGSGVGALVVAPFTAGVTALLYVDRRMRAEGLDVALQAAAAGP